MDMIKYPKIGQFRDALHEVKRRASFQGLDDDGEPILRLPATLPTLRFAGTVKLHGTNAAVVVHPDGTIHYQSRNRILTPDDERGYGSSVQSDKPVPKPDQSVEDNVARWLATRVRVELFMFDREFIGFGSDEIDACHDVALQIEARGIVDWGAKSTLSRESERARNRVSARKKATIAKQGKAA